MTVLLGLAYPFAITGISQFLFRQKANGSLVMSGQQSSWFIPDRAELYSSQVFSWAAFCP